MPILFIGSGLVLILTGLKGDAGQLWALIQGDFTGDGNFAYWLIAILVLGGLGYVEQLRGLSRMFLALVVVALLLHNQGFFTQLQKFVDSSTGAHTQ